MAAFRSGWNRRVKKFLHTRMELRRGYPVWTYVVAGLALVAIAFAITAPPHSSAVAQLVEPAAVVEARADAAAGVAFKIVTMAVMSRTAFSAPLTGDGSN